MISHAMTRTVLTGLAATALAITTIAGTAGVASAADTNVTFELGGGGLAIAAPASSSLKGITPGGGSFSGSLGPVTVTDNRGALVAKWTVSVSSTDFTTGAGTAAEVVPASAVAYVAGAPTLTGTSAIFVPAGSLSLSATPAQIGAGTAVGSNTAEWNPVLTFTIPQSAVAGTYTGTITHSVT